jgi:hypothetical protein
VRRLVRARREALQRGKVPRRRAVVARPAEEEPVEQFAGLERGAMLLLAGASVDDTAVDDTAVSDTAVSDTALDDTAALAPLASQGGALTVLSAVSSLYPAATIALGVVIRRLRPARIQVAGITLALIGTMVLGFATG